MFIQQRQWFLEIGGKHYSITFKPGGWPSRHILDINGTPTEITTSDLFAIVAVDYPFKLAGKEAHFVLVGKKADLAVDGKYTDSGAPYKSLKKIDLWVLPFIIGCLTIPLISKGGLVMIMLGLISASKFLRFSIQPFTSLRNKVLLCGATLVAAWILFILFLISNGIIVI